MSTRYYILEAGHEESHHKSNWQRPVCKYSGKDRRYWIGRTLYGHNTFKYESVWFEHYWSAERFLRVYKQLKWDSKYTNSSGHVKPMKLKIHKVVK